MKIQFSPLILIILLILVLVLPVKALKQTPSLVIQGKIAEDFGDLKACQIIVKAENKNFLAEILPDRTYCVVIPQDSLDLDQEVRVFLRNKKDGWLVVSSSHIITESDLVSMTIVIDLDPLIPRITKRIKITAWARIKTRR